MQEMSVTFLEPLDYIHLLSINMQMCMCMYVYKKKEIENGKSIQNITLQYSISTIFIVKRTNIFRENIHMKFFDDTGFLLCHSLHSYGILASQDYMIVVVVIFSRVLFVLLLLRKSNEHLCRVNHMAQHFHSTIWLYDKR